MASGAQQLDFALRGRCDNVKNEMKILGEYAGKYIAAETAKQARKIVVGG